jgi:hypothetical protein
MKKKRGSGNRNTRKIFYRMETKKGLKELTWIIKPGRYKNKRRGVDYKQ